MSLEEMIVQAAKEGRLGAFTFTLWRSARTDVTMWQASCRSASGGWIVCHDEDPQQALLAAVRKTLAPTPTPAPQEDPFG
jgi:hypothetical protein